MTFIVFTFLTSKTRAACLYELTLARKYGLKIVPIKGTDIKWEDLNQIEVQDKRLGPLDLSKMKGFELKPESFNTFCDEIYEYVLEYESELKSLKKKQEELDNEKREIKERIIEYIRSEGFMENLRENFDEFEKNYKKTSKNEISFPEFFSRWEQILNKEV